MLTVFGFLYLIFHFSSSISLNNSIFCPSSPLKPNPSILFIFRISLSTHFELSSLETPTIHHRLISSYSKLILFFNPIPNHHQSQSFLHLCHSKVFGFLLSNTSQLASMDPRCNRSFPQSLADYTPPPLYCHLLLGALLQFIFHLPTSHLFLPSPSLILRTRFPLLWLLVSSLDPTQLPFIHLPYSTKVFFLDPFFSLRKHKVGLAPLKPTFKGGSIKPSSD